MRTLPILLAVGALFLTASLPALAAADGVRGAHVGFAGGPGPAVVAGRQARARVHWLAGQASAVGAGSLTIGVLWTGPHDGWLGGQTVTVSVPVSTRINGPHHRPIALAQIQSGDLVALRVSGESASSLTAARIRVSCDCHWVGGTIASVGSSSFTVAVSRTGPYDTVLRATTITLQTGADTVYLRGRRRSRIGFSDLKVGDGVGVVFSADGFFRAPGFDPSTATFTASRVHLWGERQVPPPSSDASAAAGVSVG